MSLSQTNKDAEELQNPNMIWQQMINKIHWLICCMEINADRWRARTHAGRCRWLVKRDIY